VDRAPLTPTPIYLMIRKTIKNQIHKPGMREDQMTKKNLLKKKIKRRKDIEPDLAVPIGDSSSSNGDS
jgi:hypothetical protein